MKVIALNSNYTSQAPECDKRVYLMADSSLAKSGKPWFLPMNLPYARIWCFALVVSERILPDDLLTAISTL